MVMLKGGEDVVVGSWRKDGGEERAWRYFNAPPLAALSRSDRGQSHVAARLTQQMNKSACLTS